MTKRLKVYLLIVFAAACIACTFAGCKIGRPGRSELLAGYNTHVTYYSNGGYFDDSTTLTVREIYFKGGENGAPFFDITSDSKGMTVKRRAFDLIGWYLPATYTEGEHAGEIKYTITYTPDENGNISDKFDENNENNKTEYVFPLYNERGGVLTDDETDRPLFSREGKNDKIKENRISVECSDERIGSDYMVSENLTEEHGLIVCAKWLPAAKIRYRLVVTDEAGNISKDKETEYTSTDGKLTIKNGDELIADAMVGEGEMPQNRERVKLNGLTFVRTYMDENLTEEIKYLSRPTEPGSPDPVVYCRYIIGKWTVITGTGSSKVEDMFDNIDDQNAKFLIMEDVAYSGSAISLKEYGDKFAYSRATIVCNGGKPITISNLKFTISSTIGNGKTYSMLGEIGEQFKISGASLTLKDISISIPRTSRSFNFYAICTGADAAAAANMNLIIDGVTATYEGTPTINNAPGDERGHWLFGISAASDEAFLAGFAGIKLTGTNNTLTPLQQS